MKGYFSENNFSGIALFAQPLVRVLNEVDPYNTYVYCNMKSNIFEKIKFYYHILTADVLFVLYVDAFYMKSVDFALKLKKKVILSWIGTDVLNAIPRIKQGVFNQNYIHKTIHVSASKWLQDELKEVGIKSLYVPNIIINNFSKNIMPKKFSILTRIAQNREVFYGIETVKKLALEYPNIEFKIAGIENYENLSVNIHCLGWIDVKEELKNSTLFLRFMEHDGESHAVIEALSLGKEVIYNYPFPFCHYVTTYNEIKEELNKLILLHNKQALQINEDSINFVKTYYSKDAVTKQYIKLFESL